MLCAKGNLLEFLMEDPPVVILTRDDVVETARVLLELGTNFVWPDGRDDLRSLILGWDKLYSCAVENHDNLC